MAGITRATAVMVAMALACSVAAAGQLDPAKLEYLGAFRPPTNFQWTNGGLAFYPDGNGGAGSILSFGHAWYSNLGEYDVPDQANLLKKADGWTYNDLPVANVLKAPPASNPPFEPGVGGFGLEYLASTGKAYYGREGNGATHGYSETDGTNPQGPWALLNIDMRRTGHYISEIPGGWAAANLPAGYALTTGFGWGGYGRGPSLYAYDPNNPDANDKLPATKLIEFSGANPWPDFDRDDTWEASAWVETFASGSAFILGGRKDTTNMGNDTAAPDEYHPYLLFWDTDDLAAIATGAKQPWDIAPFAQVDLTDLYFGTGLGFDGMALDRANHILYVQEDENTTQVIHVFQIVPEPATMALLGVGCAAMVAATRRKR